MADIHTAIVNNTLSDDASVAELFKRQGQFTNDRSLSEDLQQQGKAIFDTALFKGTPAAMQVGTPVVALLRSAIEAIGALYLEQEQRDVINATGSGHEHRPKEVDDATSSTALDAASSPTGDKHQTPEDYSELDKIPAAMGMRQKRPRATHAPQGRMSAAAGVVKALKRTSASHASTSKPPSSFTQSDTNTNTKPSEPTQSSRQTRSISKPSLDKETTSLIVRLKVPKFYLQNDRNSKSKRGTAEPKFKRRHMKSKVKSDEFVRSESEGEERDETTAKSKKGKAAKKWTRRPILKYRIKSEELVKDDSEEEGEEGMVVGARRSPRSLEVEGQSAGEVVGEMDEEMGGTKKVERRVTRSRTSEKSPVETDEAEKKAQDDDEDEEMRDPDEPAPRTTRSRSTKSSPSNGSLTQPGPDVDVHEKVQATSSTSWSTTSSLSSPPSSSPPKPDVIKASSPSFPTAAKPARSKTYTFPPFPSLELRKRVPFHLGATIALENILEDHQLNPDETFLELIQGLEDNRPTVDDWERRAILKGGTWIYDTLKPFAKGRGKKGKKGVDVMGLVGQLEEWVGAEWTGLRPREVVRVVGSEESGDEGENDGEGEGDGGEVEAVEEMKGEVVKMDVDEA